jgi:hypothetical protein
MLLGGLQIVIFNFSTQSAIATESLFESQEGIEDMKNAFGWGEENPDVRVIIANIIKIILGFLGIIFVCLMIFAGVRYMTSAGNEDQAKKSLSQIKDAVIGLVIVLTSWVITTAIIRYVTRAVNNNTQLLD